MYRKALIESLEGTANIECSMFKRFLQLVSEESFDNIWNDYFLEREESFDDCFMMFHKSIRQTDFYNIGEGVVDMLFWDFIYMSEVPYKKMKNLYEDDWTF